MTGDANGDVAYHENTGTKTSPAFAGAETNTRGFSNSGGNAAIASGDVDRDGDVDVVVGNADGLLATYFLPEPGFGTALTIGIAGLAMSGSRRPRGSSRRR